MFFQFILDRNDEKRFQLQRSRQLCSSFGVFIVNFDGVLLVSLLLTLNIFHTLF